jgi:hypothetical protein
VTLVNGESAPVKASSGHSGGSTPIIQLKSFKIKKTETASKKVVGLEFEAPKANDGRFEDA